MKRLLLIVILSRLLLSAYADDRQLDKLQYWFDNNQSAMKELTLSGIQQKISEVIDASNLHEGMHILYYRVGDNEGQWSPLQVWTFFVASIGDKDDKAIKSVEYWVDDNIAGCRTTEVIGNVWRQPIDASSLHEGMHTLYYRVGDTSGQWSPLQVWTFLVVPIRDKGAREIVSVEYWMDGGFADLKTAEVSGGTWQQTLDVSGLSEGVHTLHYRFVDNYGYCSAVSQTLFSKVRQGATQVKKLHYWWGTFTDKAEDIEVDAMEYSYAGLLSVPDYARQDPLTDKGVARFNCVAIDDQGRQSASFYEDVIYGTGPELTVDKYNTTAGSSVKLSWTYDDPYGIKDFIVYYSKNNGPFVMYIPSIQTNSTEFKGDKGTYRFLVVVRNNAGQRTSMDYEWTVTVTFE